MSSQGKPKGETAATSTTSVRTRKGQQQSQLDFELDFFGRILERHSDYVDILRVQGNNFTLKGRFAEGLQIDKRLVGLRPDDPNPEVRLAELSLWAQDYPLAVARYQTDNKAFPSKVAQGRKACPVSRARPINLATEAQPLVRKVDE